VLDKPSFQRQLHSRRNRECQTGRSCLSAAIQVIAAANHLQLLGMGRDRWMGLLRTSIAIYTEKATWRKQIIVKTKL
jgi:hypothetical protein